VDAAANSSLWKINSQFLDAILVTPPPSPPPLSPTSPFHDCFSQTGAESTSAPGRLLFGPWFFVSNVFVIKKTVLGVKFFDVVAKMAMTIYRKN
jgi:hypothetical protein